MRQPRSAGRPRPVEAKMVKGACCVAAAVLLFLPLALWLCSANRMPAAQREAVARQFVTPDLCNPQPGERLAYLAGAVLLPAALFGLAFLLRRCEPRAPAMPGLRGGVGLALAAALAVLAWLALLGDNFYYLRRNVFFTAPLLALPLLPAALAAMWWDLGGRRPARPVLHLLAAGTAGLVGLACVSDERGQYCGSFHFTAVFFPVVQVWQGRAVLIDCASQYGLYPHLLQPLFAVLGLSVLKFTAVMGALTAAAYLALWSFLARATGSLTAAFLGFGALLFNGWFSFVGRSEDPYYQYFPIRFLFPALLVLLGGRYLRRPSRRLYVGLLALLAAGALWNLDSGLPALLGWTATLCFGELCAPPGWRGGLRRATGHLAAAAGALAGAAALYSAAIRLAYGAFPDYGRLLAYQRTYYGAGYMKCSADLPGTWMLAALVYLAGFAYAALALAAGRDTPRARTVFLLSVLGVGLSSYFEGRSKPLVLLLVWWPALLLLTLFLDELLARLRSRPRDVVAWAATTALGWVTVGSASSLVPGIGSVGGAVASGLRALTGGAARPAYADDADLLRRSVPPAGKVLVASPSSAVLHLASGRGPAFPASFFQLVRMEEFRALGRVLAEGPSIPVLVDRSTLALEGWQARNEGLRALVGLLGEQYEVAAATGRSVLFVRRTKGQGLPEPGGDAPFRARLRDGALGAGVTFFPCALHAPWSLEVVVNPAADQVPYAAVVGNHPGRGVGGFILHMESPTSCAFVAGDGKTWHTPVRFGARPGVWNHLVLVDDGAAVTAYVDGRPVASGAAAGLEVEDSPLPVQVGNWCGGDRPFHGLVRAARILNRAMFPQEIAERAECVRLRGP